MKGTVLVTGATGMAGRHVVPALLAAGYAVRGQYHRAPGGQAEVDWRQCDFRQSLDVGPLVDGCDAVVNLAASLSDTGQMTRLNVETTQALGGAAMRAGVRYFAQASSVVVYGSPRRRHVDERTPVLDPARDVDRQYFAEPYMRAYARSKVLGELALREIHAKAAGRQMSIDLLRPSVVAEPSRLCESLHWITSRKIFALYRRTQYIPAVDAAAAVVHLLHRGLERRGGIEAFNICDENCGTFRQLALKYRQATGDKRHDVPVDIPAIADLAMNLARYRVPELRYPLGMLRFSNAKLAATGFRPPLGIHAALAEAFAQHNVQSAPSAGATPSAKIPQRTVVGKRA